MSEITAQRKPKKINTEPTPIPEVKKELEISEITPTPNNTGTSTPTETETKKLKGPLKRDLMNRNKELEEQLLKMKIESEKTKETLEKKLKRKQDKEHIKKHEPIKEEVEPEEPYVEHPVETMRNNNIKISKLSRALLGYK